MFDTKHLILCSILICQLVSPSIGKSDDEYTLDGKRGVLNETLLPAQPLPDVEELKIYACSFQEVSADAFKSLPNLKKIVIKDSEFNSLPLGLFQNVPKLKKIDIKGTKFQNVDNGTFTNLAKLERLEIDSSNIKLHPNMFVGCLELEELEFNQCQMEIFEPSFLNGINLEELELKNNGIEEFSFKTFPRMTNLNEINLSGNPLSSLDVSGIEENCPNLKKIKLKKTNTSADTVKLLTSLNIKVKRGD